jgi:hypothetical protein
MRSDLEDGMSEGVRSLLLALGGACVGTVYVLYLRAEPFPPDVVRLVPIAWLGASIFGGVRAAGAITRKRNRVAAGLAFALQVASTGFAAIYAMAALTGG